MPLTRGLRPRVCRHAGILAWINPCLGDFLLPDCCFCWQLRRLHPRKPLGWRVSLLRHVSLLPWPSPSSRAHLFQLYSKTCTCKWGFITSNELSSLKVFLVLAQIWSVQTREHAMVIWVQRSMFMQEARKCVRFPEYQHETRYAESGMTCENILRECQ